MSPAHELAEQNLSATSPSPTGTSYPGRDKDEADRPRFVRMTRVTRQEWAPSILIFLLDVLTWMALYGMASYLRNDNAAFFGPFQFAVIEIIQVVVIVQALFIIGGRRRRTECFDAPRADERTIDRGSAARTGVEPVHQP